MKFWSLIGTYIAGMVTVLPFLLPGGGKPCVIIVISGFVLGVIIVVREMG